MNVQCGLHGCRNRACSISWPEVVKGLPNHGALQVQCFDSVDMNMRQTLQEHAAWLGILCLVIHSGEKFNDAKMSLIFHRAIAQSDMCCVHFFANISDDSCITSQYKLLIILCKHRRSGSEKRRPGITYHPLPFPFFLLFTSVSFVCQCAFPVLGVSSPNPIRASGGALRAFPPGLSRALLTNHFWCIPCW